MFKKTRAKVRAAFELFIKTFSDLATAIREQTANNHTIETSASLRHAELLAAIGAVEASTKYVATSEKRRNEREGRHHV